ncbi:hypothetical protein [Atrimonas thermophila]|uniref:hypothetical protein n=1 Tax=Atrimonas thermophila TaxID=3064161 RepID=UPI00399D14DD
MRTTKITLFIPDNSKWVKSASDAGKVKIQCPISNSTFARVTSPAHPGLGPGSVAIPFVEGEESLVKIQAAGWDVSCAFLGDGWRLDEKAPGRELGTVRLRLYYDITVSYKTG